MSFDQVSLLDCVCVWVRLCFPFTIFVLSCAIFCATEAGGLVRCIVYRIVSFGEKVFFLFRGDFGRYLRILSIVTALREQCRASYRLSFG